MINRPWAKINCIAPIHGHVHVLHLRDETLKTLKKNWNNNMYIKLYKIIRNQIIFLTRKRFFKTLYHLKFSSWFLNHFPYFTPLKKQVQNISYNKSETICTNLISEPSINNLIWGKMDGCRYSIGNNCIRDLTPFINIRSSTQIQITKRLMNLSSFVPFYLKAENLFQKHKNKY